MGSTLLKHVFQTRPLQIHDFQTRPLLAFSLVLIGWTAPVGRVFGGPAVCWLRGADCGGASTGPDCDGAEYDEADCGGATVAGPDCDEADCDEAHCGGVPAAGPDCGGVDCDEAPIGPGCDGLGVGPDCGADCDEAPLGPGCDGLGVGPDCGAGCDSVCCGRIGQ